MERSEILQELATVIAEIHLPCPTRIVIDGRDGAGKTMLANELAGALRARGRKTVRASVDGFHNPRAIRYYRGRHSPEGCFRDTFNYDAMREMLLEPFGPGGSREYRTAAFDWRTDSPALSPLLRAAEDDILIVDGIFTLRPQLLEHWHFRIFVDVRVEVGDRRCIERDGSTGDSESNARYHGAQDIYFAECNPKSLADVVIDNNDLAAPILNWNLK